MASEQAVMAALKTLARAFAGIVDGERVELYHAALEDVSDAQLAQATVKLVRTYAGEFIPPPAKIRAAIGMDQVAPSDVDATLSAIERLSIYNPHSGMIPPSVVRVREALGAAVAEAYAEAGAQRLFSENQTGREIARAAFAPALTAWQQRASVGALPAPKDAIRLNAGGPLAGLLGAGE